MERVTQGIGALLIALGAAGYVVSGADSPTALLPALLGVVLLVLGVLAQRQALRRHAIHGALVVALLGLLGTLMQVAELPALISGGDVERPIAIVAGTLTFLACLAYLALGIRSFATARRASATD